MQGLFRTGVCLFMLSGTCVLFAQNETPAEQADAPKKEQKAKEKAPAKKVALKEAMGSTQSIMVGPDGELYGASDPRSVDDLTAGY